MAAGVVSLANAVVFATLIAHVSAVSSTVVAMDLCSKANYQFTRT
jgi:hypothetical protein|eukprot:COSAG02_NODE_4748_length_5028_cov_2.319537_4_plen_45_part_00